MTRDELTTLADGLAPAIRDALAAVTQRVDVLERALDTITATRYVKFCGVWAPGRAYVVGDAVTYAGGLWICKASTSGKPSDDHASWQLAVKRGRAG
jgi:hypothetical protein